MVKLGEEKQHGLGSQKVRDGAKETARDGDYRTIAVEAEYLHGTVNETTVWDVYNNEARKVDRELVKDWTASLNFLLVFAAIFSAILAAFTIESKKLLEENTSELMLDVMIFYTNSLANGSHFPYKRPEFKPSDSAVSINCLLFCSLSTSLLAALASVVALQWVADFDASITRGGSSPQDRAKRRQFRFGGVKQWKMGELIDALPLLLNISVVLFFAGVIQWTLALNSIVGCVVTGGAATALLFYFITTFLAVIFDSSPFKTPLSLWIYAGYCRILIVLNPTMSLFHLGNSHKWCKSHRAENYASNKREDRVVKARMDLHFQALNWLARQISISEDSRRRLSLLVSELLEWPPEQFESLDFKQAPWVIILNFLAQKHIAALHVSQQTRDEETELALLVNCAALPSIKAAIAPANEHAYWSNPKEARYWSQHCINYRDAAKPFYSFLRSAPPPDPLFLLTRDIPIPSLGMVDEMENATRLAKWRNRAHKPLGIWKDVVATSNHYSDEFFNASVCLLNSSSMITSPHAPNAATIRLDIIATITQRAVRGKISSIALTGLIRAFEHVLDPYKFWLFRKSPACIQRPLSYARNLQQRDQDVNQIHRTMTLLLARDMQGCSGPESMQRFKQVLAMLWLAPPTTDSHDLRALGDEYEINCRVSDLTREIIHDWVLHVDVSPEFAETFYVLVQTSLTHPEIGVDWLHSCAMQSRKHLFSLLKCFDDLMCDNRWSGSWPKILRVLCKTLRMEASGIIGKQTSTYCPNFSIMTLNSPFIRTIGYRALEIDTVNEAMPEYPLDQSALMDETLHYLFWNMSDADSRSVWQLRASWLSESLKRCYSNVAKGILNDSFSKPEQLCHLVSVFTNSALCDHNVGPGHALVHLNMEYPDQITYPHDLRLFDDIQVKSCRITPIIALLCVSSAGELISLGLIPRFDDECMAQLWDIYAMFKDHPPSMLAFLCDILLWHSQVSWNYEPETLAIVLKTIKDNVGPATDREWAALLLQVSTALFHLSGHMTKRFANRKHHSILMLETERIRNIILNRLCSIQVFGRHNLRLLACAQASMRPLIL